MAPVGIVVKAHVHCRYLDSFAQFPVDFVDHLCPLQPPSHVRLIRHDHEGISGSLQPTKRGCNVWIYLEFVHRAGWVRSTLADYGPVDDPVTVEEHGRLAQARSGGHVSLPELTSSRIASNELRIARRVDMALVQRVFSAWCSTGLSVRHRSNPGRYL